MTKRRSNFLADVWYELTTKVVWPTWNRMVLATTVVIIFILFWATVLWAFDSAFVSFQGWLVNDTKVQEEWNRIQEANQPATSETAEDVLESTINQETNNTENDQ
ncbi:MAG TPA: preprotein translocase subunit SecE [Caldisericia bacterium]|nr:preprotein translocase subunit SecE [Caldisericia bacterium]HPF48437.1 preprotein translocase subunit SecE [Caldisericia bacterium]HPI83383.1 preprotein translocase subunit SecE [Caldisericia bacterium]HPQ92891.1 preprotein translocase subunit SecE [Caldisericia bacterium]HRV74011.1 preprotein translocase subunit SecE [Caldisericia bacterium]